MKMDSKEGIRKDMASDIYANQLFRSEKSGGGSRASLTDLLLYSVRECAWQTLQNERVLVASLPLPVGNSRGTGSYWGIHCFSGEVGNRLRKVSMATVQRREQRASRPGDETALDPDCGVQLVHRRSPGPYHPAVTATMRQHIVKLLSNEQQDKDVNHLAVTIRICSLKETGGKKVALENWKKEEKLILFAKVVVVHMDYLEYQLKTHQQHHENSAESPMPHLAHSGCEGSLSAVRSAGLNTDSTRHHVSTVTVPSPQLPDDFSTLKRDRRKGRPLLTLRGLEILRFFPLTREQALEPVRTHVKKHSTTAFGENKMKLAGRYGAIFRLEMKRPEVEHTVQKEGRASQRRDQQDMATAG
ncbi:PREDICTED: uncharacterized protein LOC106149764 [Chinchilla lanigera]|uniref:uncharacterized protein LOC106149764 n=1 Tax=Chinchilla lanigera TaxID=34839 RepID=UPI0006964AD2|nr:PREDICTED: uncharacterized protein LOC106149764 [Chinchilla lanigera]